MFVSFVTILFIQYSSFSSSLLNFFNCWEINDETLLLRDMMIKCWESKHLIWALVFGLPGLTLVIFVIPFAGILFLVLKRNSAERPKFMQYFILLYQGYKIKIIYWEFINIIRKIILTVILSVIPFNLVYYKGMIAFIFVLIFWRFQKRL